MKSKLQFSKLNFNTNKTTMFIVLFLLSFSSINANELSLTMSQISPDCILNDNTFVDSNLEEAQLLYDKVSSQQKNSEVFHLFSHGQPGQLFLSNKWLDASQIASFLQGKLSDEITHINIYGCEFAKGEKGKQAVSYLETAFGVSVAASEDITGKDGDWELEAGLSTSSLSIKEYQYNLQCTDTSATGDCDGDGILNSIDTDPDNDGILTGTECNLVSGEYLGTFGESSGPLNRDLEVQPPAGYVWAPVANTADGQYAVINGNTNSWHPTGFWDNLNGHTTGDGDDAYLAVNGSINTGIFYEQAVFLSANTTYNIGLWAANANPSSAKAIQYPVELGVRLINSSGK